MLAGRHLAIAIVISVAARNRESLSFESKGLANESKIGIAVARDLIELNLGFAQPRFEPVLEVIFLIGRANGFDELIVSDRYYGANATGKLGARSGLIS